MRKRFDEEDTVPLYFCYPSCFLHLANYQRRRGTGMLIGQAYTKWLTTPEREALATGCDLLIDHLFEDLANIMGRKLERVASTKLAIHLPRRYLPKYTPVILKQFAVCILTVAWKLAQPKHIRLACLAEELAAWSLLTELRGS
jgi:hypothetical protein